MLILVSACAGGNESGDNADASSFIGYGIADEPEAALIGRDILIQGGTAADAVTAMYFTMAVTLPSQASLGGGGLCMIYDAPSGKTTSLDFLAPAGASRPGADRPSAIPATPRGFYALQTRYGRLRWEQLLTPAETRARFGVNVSRALGRDLASLEDALLQDPEFQRIFGADGGRRLVRDGDLLVQPELASTIAQLRTATPADFYAGDGAGRLVNAVKVAGGTLDIPDLYNFRPQWNDPLVLETDQGRVSLPPSSFIGARLTARILTSLSERDVYEDATETDRPWILADATSRAYAEGGASGLYNPSGATLIAVDATGSAVSCAVGLNGLFGTGRIAPGTGIVLAAAPGDAGRGSVMLTPMIVSGSGAKSLTFAAAATGGLAAPAALAQVSANILMSEQPVELSVNAARILGGGVPGTTVLENQASDALAADLAGHGTRLAYTPTLGRVSAVYCPGGLPDSPAACRAAADPRGLGMIAGGTQ